MFSLSYSQIKTPLGPMHALADERALYLLEFTNGSSVSKAMQKFREKFLIAPGIFEPIRAIEEELDHYFSGHSSSFETPLQKIGTPFQLRVWEELERIPFGETRSYWEIAKAVGNPLGVRAVAQANGANPLTLVIPCHRVIQKDGKIGGYGGGVERKKRLLSHEKGEKDALLW